MKMGSEAMPSATKSTGRQHRPSCSCWPPPRAPTWASRASKLRGPGGAASERLLPSASPSPSRRRSRSPCSCSGGTASPRLPTCCGEGWGREGEAGEAAGTRGPRAGGGARGGGGRPPGGADTYSIGARGDLHGAVDFVAAPAIGLGGPGGYSGSQLADRWGPAGRAERRSCGLGRRRAEGWDAEGRETPLCSSAAAGASSVSTVSALLSPPLPPDSPPLPTSAEPGSRLFVRDKGGAKAPWKEGLGSPLFVSWGCRPLRFKKKVKDIAGDKRLRFLLIAVLPSHSFIHPHSILPH